MNGRPTIAELLALATETAERQMTTTPTGRELLANPVTAKLLRATMRAAVRNIVAVMDGAISEATGLDDESESVDLAAIEAHVIGTMR